MTRHDPNLVEVGWVYWDVDPIVEQIGRQKDQKDS